MEGRLKVWNGDKGFGFISSPGAKDVFVHISALKKMSRRPVVGDVLTFQCHTDNNGKVRATQAQIRGVASTDLTSRSRVSKQLPAQEAQPKSFFSGLLTVLGLIAVAVIGYEVYQRQIVVEVQAQTLVSEASHETPVFTKIVKSQFSCRGKVYCSEVTSCAEAKFYVQNCSGTKMDGDHDGVPCESQWCN
ncbi:excalibur calcium-binding domain-containing protein [Leucothrix arctica]|uniref:Cold-shock protein n=1 Tax=Leucothrix arctica TaxID=1481894 RepID=A0A317CGC8_9GAMM|nr:excalibur calcium-binding domain-containing protein [Leucothrix arctica]PWQ97576.1 cold-shock protein [Leucothrix arctica]